MKKRDIPFLLLAFFIYIFFKYMYVFLDNDNLIFLLKPTAYLIEIITGTNFIFSSDSGFFYEQLNIIINKSCSGYNFWILSFLMLAFLSIKRFNNSIKKISAILIALLSTYILTIFVNTSRIYVSISIQKLANIHLQSRPHYLIHEIVGITVNLFFFILIYVLTDKLLTNKTSHEKLT